MPAASSGTDSPYVAKPGGIGLAVRLQPKASRAGFDRVARDADGNLRVCARVNVLAEGGKANRALVKLNAAAVRVPASRISVAAGQKDRRKTVMIEGDTAELIPRLERWLEEIE